MLAKLSAWRHARPFWGGLLLMFGGAWVILLPAVLAADFSPLPIYLHLGMSAMVGLVVGLVMIIGGVLIWFTPSNRVFIACITAAFSVFSLIASNLGGFIVGMMAGIIGSCLAFAWTPDKGGAPKPRRRDQPKPPEGRPPEPEQPEFVPWYRRESVVGAAAANAWPKDEERQR